MLYRFPEMFYKNPPSACAPLGSGELLSAGDRDGLKHLYPGEESESSAIVEKQRAMLAAMGDVGKTGEMGLERLSQPLGQQIGHAAAILRWKLQSFG
jgi:hypothetical protein